jgi:chromosome segregation ATPase
MDYNEEQITQLSEELEQARAEVEGLQATVADREARALHVESQLSQARDELATAQQGLEARDGEIESLRTRADTLESAVRESAVRYRAIAMEREPDLPGDLIDGETIDDVDQAIERARETVARVRGHLEAQAQSNRVPVGAPARPEPDTSKLSAQEKIARGIEGRTIA